MQVREERVRGLPMRWQEIGEGVPLVLVHGIPTGPALWRRVLPRVTGARCLAFEMVGYAGSIPAGRGRDVSVARQADYLLSWLEEIGVERAVLAGHNLGGGVVQIAAVRRPEICAGLFLSNAIAYDSWPIPSVKALRAGHRLLRRLPAAAVDAAIAPLMLRGHDDRAVARESLGIHRRPYHEHDGAAALARQVRSLDVRDTLTVADRLPDLRVPARLVWGAADQFQKVEYGERLAWDLRGELVRVEGGRHFVPEDHPEAVVTALDELVAAAAGWTPGPARRPARDVGAYRPPRARCRPRSRREVRDLSSSWTGAAAPPSISASPDSRTKPSCAAGRGAPGSGSGCRRGCGRASPGARRRARRRRGGGAAGAARGALRRRAGRRQALGRSGDHLRRARPARRTGHARAGAGRRVASRRPPHRVGEIIVDVAPVTLAAGAPLLPRRLTAARLELVGVERRGQFARLQQRLRPPGGGTAGRVPAVR